MTPYVLDLDDLFVLVALSLPLLLPVPLLFPVPVAEASDESPVEEAPDEAALLSEPVVAALLSVVDESESDDLPVAFAVDCADEASPVEEAAAVESAATMTCQH